jgi:methylthioribulose-1-phosphate dehydratase
VAVPTFRSAASTLAQVGRRFYDRGWVLGTSGNFSAVVSRAPLQLAITASGASKGTLGVDGFLRCDAAGQIVGRRTGTPSAETLLHIEVVKRRGATAVLHTHSIWATMLSDRHAARGGLCIEQYEMLKGLSGVTSHEHREWIPILDNDQDMPRLASHVGETLTRHPDAHAFLLRRHGLYTWGATIAEAERHVETLEFLFEAMGRARTDTNGRPRSEARHGDRANSGRESSASRR